jgi:3-oxoacyl-[acyl-carrier protein] reductase
MQFEGLEGATALVTGAGSGIGREVAHQLADHGCRVALVDLRPDAVRSTQRELEREGHECLAEVVDVSDGAAVSVQIADVLRRWEHVDVLANCAGIHETASLTDLTTQRFQKMLAVNILGVFHVTAAVVPVMLRRRRGSIVSIASLSGVRGHPVGAGGTGGGAHYAAAKGAVLAFTKSIAKELAPHGVRANCIAPAMVDTPMVRRSYTSEQIAQYASAVPLGRLGTPKDIADAVMFLASGNADFITGQVLNVCGGVSI